MGRSVCVRSAGRRHRHCTSAVDQSRFAAIAGKLASGKPGNKLPPLTNMQVVALRSPWAHGRCDFLPFFSPPVVIVLSFYRDLNADFLLSKILAQQLHRHVVQLDLYVLRLVGHQLLQRAMLHSLRWIQVIGILLFYSVIRSIPDTYRDSAPLRYYTLGCKSSPAVPNVSVPCSMFYVVGVSYCYVM